jgi:hypothetical protein
MLETPIPTIIKAMVDETRYGNKTAVNNPVEIKIPQECSRLFLPIIEMK